MSLTPAIPRSAPRDRKGSPHLLEVLDGAAPYRPLLRHCLAGSEEIVLGRGDGTAREGRTLRLGLPDRWMSTGHARLRREGEGWLAEDLGSTNGTFVNGEPMHEREIVDGDVLEMGDTHLIFRVSAAEGPLAAPPHETLATLSAELEMISMVFATAISALHRTITRRFYDISQLGSCFWRFAGGLHLAGFDTGVISSRRKLR